MGRPRDPRTESVMFNGVEYLRAPSEAYFRSTVRGGDRLHRDVWRYHRGPIPAGHDIHHKDEDTGNNDIRNLECLSDSAHGKRHRPPGANAALLDRVRPLAKEWHSTEEGRDFHRRHGREVLAREWARAPYHRHVCTVCGKEYKSRAKNVGHKFCSPRCKEKVRVRGLLRKFCAYCADEFTTREARSECCSKRCGCLLWRFRKRKNAGV